MTPNVTYYLSKIDHFITSTVLTEIVNTSCGIVKKVGQHVPFLTTNVSSETLNKWLTRTNVERSSRREDRAYILGFAPIACLSDSWTLFKKTLNPLIAVASSVNQTHETIAAAVGRKAHEKFKDCGEIKVAAIKRAVRDHLEREDTNKDQGISKLEFGINVASVACRVFGGWAIRCYVAHKFSGIFAKDFQYIGTLAGIYAWTKVLVSAKEQSKERSRGDKESPTLQYIRTWIDLRKTAKFGARTAVSYYLSSFTSSSIELRLIATLAGVALWSLLPTISAGQKSTSPAAGEKMINEELLKHLESRAKIIFKVGENEVEDTVMAAFTSSLGRLKFPSQSSQVEFEEIENDSGTKKEEKGSSTPSAKKPAAGSKKEKEISAEALEFKQAAEEHAAERKRLRGAKDSNYLFEESLMYSALGNYYYACSDLTKFVDNYKKRYSSYKKYCVANDLDLAAKFKTCSTKLEENFGKHASCKAQVKELKAHIQELLKPAPKKKNASVPASSSSSASTPASKKKSAGVSRVLDLGDKKKPAAAAAEGDEDEISDDETVDASASGDGSEKDGNISE